LSFCYEVGISRFSYFGFCWTFLSLGRSAPAFRSLAAFPSFLSLAASLASFFLARSRYSLSHCALLLRVVRCLLLLLCQPLLVL
jgi:hypothetical protein